MAESEGRARRANVSSLLAGCLAVLALSVSLWQGYEERRHNRLSVRPLLTFNHTYDPEGWYSLEVINTGVGPAIIQGFEAFVDGQPVSDGAVWAQVMSLLGEDVELMHSYDFFVGDGFPPGSRQKLIQLNPRLPEAGRVRLEIRYESIYGESWTESATF